VELQIKDMLAAMQQKTQQAQVAVVVGLPDQMSLLLVLARMVVLVLLLLLQGHLFQELVAVEGGAQPQLDQELTAAVMAQLEMQMALTEAQIQVVAVGGLVTLTDWAAMEAQAAPVWSLSKSPTPTLPHSLAA
jgi:hypothetical protein